MARSLQKREVILLLVLGGVAAWVWSAGGDPAPPATPAAAKAEKEAAARRAAPVLRMDLLAHAEPTTEGGMRDLFKYEPRPPTPSEVRRQQELERQRMAELKRQQAEAERLEKERLEKERLLALQRANEPPPPPPRPIPPAIPFAYIGLLGPKESKIGVFEEGKDIVIARVGETVRREFKLLELKHDAAVIGYVKKEFQDQRRELPMKRR